MSGAQMNKIEVKNVFKIFGPRADAALALIRQGRSKAEVLAQTGCVVGVNDLSLSIGAGEIFVIMGLSGSGKSTLVRHFNRLIDPTSGEILVDGEDILRYDMEALRQFRRRKISMVFQSFGLLPHKSVLDNVAYGLKVRGESRAQCHERALHWIATVGLKGYEKSYPHQLSGGMRQRVGLARALAADTEIILMDEAFRPRPVDPRGHAGPVAGTAENPAQDHRLHHPRPRRGGTHRQPHRDPQGRPADPGRHTTGNPPPAGRRLRRPLRPAAGGEPMSDLPSVVFGDGPLRWQELVAVARHGARLELSAAAWARIDNARAIVCRIVANGERAYGISTGLGALCDVLLEGEQLAELSRNTLLSHACGVGEPLRDEQTRAIICAAVANYSQGKSGLDRSLVEGLLALLNHGITPQVPAQGSVGYLTHMAHVGIALLGIGEVSYRGSVVPAAAALAAEGLATVRLGAKDGLCLVNGTPCMTGLACLALDDAQRLAQWADVIGAMSFEALRGQLAAFDAEIVALKPHPGMQRVAANLRALLAGSQVLENARGIRTQDALSIRSIPQIHGACRDQLAHAARQIETELNSATDNPLLLGTPEAYRVVSQANPHGESVAMAADLLAIAVAELGGVAERRLDRLVNPLVSGLPAFLVGKPGVNSGMMITQYVAASLAGENRQLAQPAVVDNFVTSALQEDHLSLGTSAALKLGRALENLRRILAIEYLLAAQAFEFLAPQRFGQGTAAAWGILRERVPAYDTDRWLAPDIASAAAILGERKSLARLAASIGDLQ